MRFSPCKTGFVFKHFPPNFGQGELWMKRLAIALIAILLLFGCTVPKKPSGNGTDNNAAVKPPIGVDLMKNVVEKGDTVKADYIGTFVDGNKFDSSIDRKEPLEFVAGAGQMIKGFDAAVIGMKLNEEHPPRTKGRVRRKE